MGTMKRKEHTAGTDIPDARKRELAAQYLERTGIPQKYNMDAQKVLDIVTDCALACRALAEVQSRLKTTH